MPGLTRGSALVVAFLCALPACVSPSNPGEGIQKSLAAEVDRLASSVAGTWRGITPVGLALAFDLQQAGSVVSGGGTITENGVTHESRYTVSGTYQRPQLTLTFIGMVYQGHVVDGSFQANYDSVGGVSGTLHLKGADYSKDIEIGLFEQQ
jgi:hypothetical protein